MSLRFLLTTVRAEGAFIVRPRGTLMSPRILCEKRLKKFSRSQQPLTMSGGLWENPSREKKIKCICRYCWWKLFDRPTKCKASDTNTKLESDDVGMKVSHMKASAPQLNVKEHRNIFILIKYWNAAMSVRPLSKMEVDNKSYPTFAKLQKKPACSHWLADGVMVTTGSNHVFRLSYPLARLSSSSSGRLFPRRSVSLR